MVVTLNASTRAEYGKEKMKKLRAAGKVPAVAYGAGLEEPLHLILDAAVLKKSLTEGGKDADFELVVGKKKYAVLIQEVQRDPVSGDFLHLDFYLPVTDK
jgi:large subunit ribosomal protein L25